MIRKIKKGLNLPIAGSVSSKEITDKSVSKVAIIGPDYNGMKPTMKVVVGDDVKIGQVLFECKKTEGVLYTSPAAGKVLEVNRGDKRAFQSVVIEVASAEEQTSFNSFQADKEIEELTTDEVKALIVESGLWTSLRTRPYSKIPVIEHNPHSIFVTAIDTNPLAPDPQPVIASNESAYQNGLSVLLKLTTGKVHVCKKAKTDLPVAKGSRLFVHEFAGVHPAGNVGTHIHFIDPVGAEKEVWHIGYQDVIALGKLFTSGKLETERVISLAGPQVKEPKLIRTRLGACLCQLTEGELKESENRIISGSVLNGRKSEEAFCYLGRYHNQISVIKECAERELLGWHSPGLNRFSVQNIYLSKLLPGKLFNFTSNANGSLRAIVPIGSYEKVMPLDIYPTLLLRSMSAKDTDQAQALGCLELDEEDLALCNFASPSKIDYGPILRETLEIIEKEG